MKMMLNALNWAGFVSPLLWNRMVLGVGVAWDFAVHHNTPAAFLASFSTSVLATSTNHYLFHSLGADYDVYVNVRHKNNGTIHYEKIAPLIKKIILSLLLFEYTKNIYTGIVCYITHIHYKQKD